MSQDELIEAIKKGDSARVSTLVDADRSLLRARSDKTSAILLSCYHGHPEIGRLLVERGAEATLPEACAIGDRTRVQALLKRDPQLLHSYSDDGYPAVGLAIFFQHGELARDLIARGADVNAAARNVQKVALVHSAATVRDRQTLKLLLERGADPNARQQLGFTPLHSAASHGDIETAKLLMQHGADPKAMTEEGKNAADIAEKYKQPAFAEWFRQRS